MIYNLTSLNSSLIKVAHIISNSNTDDSHYTSWIGIVGVLLSVTISTIVTLIIHHSEESKDSERVHTTLRNASDNTERQIESTNENLREKLIQNRKDIYSNALRVYIYKEIDVMINKLIDIMTKSTAISSDSKVLLSIKLRVSDKTIRLVINKYINLLNSNSYIGYKYMYEFIILKHALNNLSDKKLNMSLFNSVIRKLLNLGYELDNVILGISGSSTHQIKVIYHNSTKIMNSCRVIIKKMSVINERHAFNEKSSNLEKDLDKHMSKKTIVKSSDLF